MPTGIYPRSKEQIQKLIEIGKKFGYKTGHPYYGNRINFFQKGNIPLNKTAGIIQVCPKCGKIRRRPPSEAHIIHCSSRCGTLGRKVSDETREKMAISHRKEGSKKLRKVRYYHYMDINYTNWRKKVFEKDNYKCGGCGEFGGYLTAHHIKSWAKFPDLRYEISNGITLCEDCHKKTDNYKGRGIGKKINVEVLTNCMAMV